MPSDRNKSAIHPRYHQAQLPGRVAEIAAIGLSTRKSQGEAAEAAFLAVASSLGFGVARPWGDSERYDFLVDSGRRVWRVQVKSTQRLAESRYRVKPGGFSASYTHDEIDFIAVYIVPEKLWYIVPVDACVGHKSLRFYPQRGRNARLEKYREAWCQLACVRDAPEPNPILVSRRCQKILVKAVRTCPSCPMFG